MPAAPDLPTDFQRQPLRFASYRQISATIETEVIRQLCMLADRPCWSLCAVILSAWGAFLHRLTGQTELVLWLPWTAEAPEQGGAQAGKTRVGMLPVSSRFEEGMTFKQHLSAIADQLAVRQASDLETAGSQDALSTKIDGSAQETFPVLFSFEFALESSVTGRSADGRCCAVSQHVCEQTACELALCAAAGANGDFELRCDYAQELFVEATVQRWLRHFLVFLTDVALDADRQLQEFDLLTVEEREQILHSWNDTRRDYPTDVCLHDLIEAQVRRTPGATALVFDGQVSTYDELNRRANRLAHRLRRCGVGPEAIVAVLAESSIETIAGFVAVLKAGGAYLPLDPSYPSERLSLILRDAQPVVVLTQRHWVQKTASHGAPVLILEDDFEAESDVNPASQTTPDNAAYVIYTSGSTGLPKGVVNIHRGICNYTIWWREYLKLTADDRFLQKVPFTFDPSVAEIFGTLISGAALVIARPGLKEDTCYLIGTICEQRVTTAFFVPSLLAAFAHDKNVVRCSSLRCVISAGEALSSELKDRFYAVLPETELVNIYGPTEAVIAVTAWRCERQSGGRPVPIGRPIANTQLYILDRAMEPVPVGFAGELHIGGAQVARGYLARPELTAKAFVPNPFGEGRLYKTGDLARYREDGTIEFLGRIDQQVKLRGQRVELGEIEAVLKKHRAVRDCVVVVRQEEAGAPKRLVAYVVANGLSPQDLRQHAQQMLPGYMVPSALVFLQELPLTANGKLDRKALAAPDVAGARGLSPQPRTRKEEILCMLFAETLGLPQVGINDSFFELGGDSIGSIQLASRAREVGLVITPRDLFECQNVERLALAASEIEKADADNSDPFTGVLSLVPAMRRFLERDDSLEYLSRSILIQMSTGIVQDLLGTALQALVDHHDALRMRLIRPSTLTKDWGFQISPPGTLRAETCLQRVDVSGLDELARGMRIKEEAEAAQRRLQLEAGIVVQAVWFDAGADQPGKLLLVNHHLVADEVSWRILIPDLAAAYEAIAAGQAPLLPPVGTSFRRWAQLVSEKAHDLDQTSELAFWRAELTKPDLPLTTEPLDPKRDVLGTARRLSFSLPPALTTSLLTAVPGAFNARITDALICAFVLAVADWRQRTPSWHDDNATNAVLIDLVGDGRKEEIFDGVDLSRTVGWFTRLFPVRLDPGTFNLQEALAGGPALGAVLKRIKEQLRRAHHHGSGHGLLRHLNPGTAAPFSRLSKPQVLFNYVDPFRLSEASHWQVVPDMAQLRHGGADLTMPFAHSLEINVSTIEGPKGPELVADWSWPSALFSEERVRALAEGWSKALSALVHHVAQPGAGGRTPSDFLLVSLTQAEIDRLEIEHPDLEDIWPLSPLQEGLLFHALYDPQLPGIYNIQTVLELAGPLDERRLQAAANALLQRHSVLRASFEHKGFDRPLQLIHSRVRPHWRTANLSDLATASREAQLAEILAQDRSKHFEPSTAPLVRFTLVRLAPETHRLLLTLSHILADGWSGPILINELLESYAGKGDSTVLAPVTSYREYLAWVGAQDRPAATAAWQDALAGLEEPTRLAPSDPGRAPMIPERLTFKLSEALSEALAQQARAHGLTLNSFFQGAWAVLLGRLTGRDDVVFGTVVASRPPELPGIQIMVGLLTNTIPVRVRLHWTDPLIKLFAQVQHERAKLMVREYVALPEIQRMVGWGELFDTLLAFENYPYEHGPTGTAFAGLRLSSVKGDNTTHYPLTLRVMPAEGFQLSFDYRPDLFERDTVREIGNRLVRLLTASAVSPEQPIGAVDLLGPEERHRLLVEWNATTRDYPTNLSLHQLIETQVAKTPEAVAVIYEGQALTYQQLDEAANALACRLQALGVRPNALVAILSERSLELVVGMVAVLKAGGAYLPLDPAHPVQRLGFILEDAKPSAVLVQDRLKEKLLPELPVPMICLQDKFETAEHPAPVSVSPDNLAYVIYTSGSTGEPKGVMIPHLAVCNFLHWIQETQALGPAERVLQKSAYTFDFSIPEFFWPLVSGATVVLATAGAHADSDYLVEVINAQHISTIDFVPAALALFLENPRIVSCRSLKRVFCGGEALSTHVVARFFERLPHAELYNGYGPTETTVFATTWQCQSQASSERSVPIGRPLANVQIYLLDVSMQPVPVGVVGELYVGGVQVARGYLARPELTAEKFVPNPFGEGRLYKTGDLARYRQDGAIEFLGRIDQQVKLRGLRIELGEIEAVLKKHPAVRACVVVVREEMEANKRLVAYVVASGVSPDELRQHARQILPDYMVPSGLVFLDSLPVTAHGKLDRRALPEPVAVDREKRLVPPRDALETQLVAVWEKVLRIQPIGMADNFFQLGGDSLLALRLFAEIEQMLGKRLPLATLFQMPTVEELAEKVREDTPPEDWGPLIAIQLQGKRSPFFAIHGRDGNVLFYRKFSQCLGKEQPFYALQAQGLDGKRIAQTSVELAAYEMARRLRAAGEEVALLLLFDTSNPARPPRVRSWTKFLRDTVRRVLSRGISLSRTLQFLAQHIRGKPGDQLLRWNESFHKLTLGWTAAHRRNAAAELLDLHVQMVHERAFLAYRPLPYRGKVTLFRTLDQDSAYEVDPDLNWSAVAQGGVEVHYVPGTHTTIFSDENVPNLARKVEECIRLALSEKPPDKLEHQHLYPKDITSYDSYQDSCF